MPEELYDQEFEISGGNFSHAGGVSTKIKSVLKQLGVDAGIIRRAAIASYEAEMNVVMYAQAATMRLAVTPSEVEITCEDRGQGIKDIELAMQEGYSTATEEMRELGFGAGMGLPNIKRNSDIFEIASQVGVGTKLRILIRTKDKCS